jgi:hypothetical protein
VHAFVSTASYNTTAGAGACVCEYSQLLCLVCRRHKPRCRYHLLVFTCFVLLPETLLRTTVHAGGCVKHRYAQSAMRLSQLTALLFDTCPGCATSTRMLNNTDHSMQVTGAWHGAHLVGTCGGCRRCCCNGMVRRQPHLDVISSGSSLRIFLISAGGALAVQQADVFKSVLACSVCACKKR